MVDPSSASYVQLSDNPVQFDPVSIAVNVFYDDANRQVFVVRSNGAGGVLVFDTDGNSTTFRIEDKGEISAVRLSPDKKVLAVQRSPNAIDFINFIEKDASSYCQTCKGKTTRVTDFFWASATELIFVTDQGVEFYEINPEKKTVKCTKTLGIGLVNWSLWDSSSRLLLISSGVYGNMLFPFIYQNGTIMKYPKVEVELAHYSAEPKLTLLQRDVILANIYKQLYVVTLKQDAQLKSNAEVVLYKLHRDKSASKSNILKLNTCGQFQLSVIDNLVLVHHLQSKTSFLYDLKFASVTDQHIAIHQLPLVSPLPMRKSAVELFEPQFGINQRTEPRYDMYSSNWILFQPNVIIDASQGCMWTIQINLSAFLLMITDRCLLVEFLLHRHGAKKYILQVLKEMVHPETASTLTRVGEIFNKLNQVYAFHEDSKQDMEQLSLTSTPLAIDAVNLIQQDDIYTNIFCRVFSDDGVKFANESFPMAVMTEYITSLQSFGLPIHFYLYELLVNTMVKYNDLYRLHQFLQYYVMDDSKHLACLLLSIQNVYPPASQIALDMLKRITTALDQIVEVFLSKYQVTTAIRYLRSVGQAEAIKPRKFLHVAKESGDIDLFYTTYKYFEECNWHSRKSGRFLPNDQCEEYEIYYRELFLTGTKMSS